MLVNNTLKVTPNLLCDFSLQGKLIASSEPSRQLGQASQPSTPLGRTVLSTTCSLILSPVQATKFSLTAVQSEPHSLKAMSTQKHHKVAYHKITKSQVKTRWFPGWVKSSQLVLYPMYTMNFYYILAHKIPESIHWTHLP